MSAGDTTYSDVMVANIEGLTEEELIACETLKNLGQSSLNTCYGLPYQDHNYGAPPPPTPPPSPGKITIKRRSELITQEPSRRPAKNTILSLDKKALSLEKKTSTFLSEKKTLRIEKKGLRIAKKSLHIDKKCLPAEKKIVLPEKKIIQSPPQKRLSKCEEEEQEDSEEPPCNGTDYDNSVTRCICSFTHDDGYMICCDQCQVWQHIDCMGIDRDNIPDEYSCEHCLPRKVYKARARMIQKRKREGALQRSTSEDENANRRCSKQIELRSMVRSKQNGRTQSFSKKPISNGINGNQKRRSLQTCINPARRAKRHSKGSTDSAFLSVDGDTEEMPSSLPYEQATGNQYSSDIDEALKDGRLNGAQHQYAKGEERTPRCKLRLLSTGHRGLEVDEPLAADEWLIEFKGKVMLQQQYEQENDILTRSHPFVLFYSNWSNRNICVDASSYGNEARFLRRSCVPNAEVRHIAENGELQFMIYSTKEIFKGCEVTIPFDYDFRQCDYCVECACVRAQCPVRKAARRLVKSLSQAGGDNKDHSNKLIMSAADQIKMRPLADPLPVLVKTEPVKPLQIQIPPKLNDEIVSKEEEHPLTPVQEVKSPCDPHSAEERKHLTREERKLEMIMKTFERMEKQQQRRNEALKRLSGKKTQADNDLKQEAAVGEQLIRHTPQPPLAGTNRRRIKSGTCRKRPVTRTTSQCMSEAEPDENSSQDTCPTPMFPRCSPEEIGSTSVGTIGFRFPKTKKRYLSDWFQENREKPVDKPLTVQTDDESIDFVKMSTSPGSSWAHLRRNSASASNSQHIVTHHTTASNTPGVAKAAESCATTAGSSQNIIASKVLDTSMGSAKKRWLRQAMTEESCDAASLLSPLSGSASPIYVPPSSDTPLSPIKDSSVDFVTPLKKRRLARESLSVDTLNSDAKLFTEDLSRSGSCFIPPVEETANHAPTTTESAHHNHELDYFVTEQRAADQYPAEASSSRESKRPDDCTACLHGLVTGDEIMSDDLQNSLNLKEQHQMTAPAAELVHEIQPVSTSGDVASAPCDTTETVASDVGSILDNTLKHCVASVDNAEGHSNTVEGNAGHVLKSAFDKPFGHVEVPVHVNEIMAPREPIMSFNDLMNSSYEHLLSSGANCASSGKEELLRSLSCQDQKVDNCLVSESRTELLPRSVSMLDCPVEASKQVEWLHVNSDSEPTSPQRDQDGVLQQPITPPTKKRVSLLEYRQRMQGKGGTSPKVPISAISPIYSFPYTSFSSGTIPKPIVPSSLPALPLFEPPPDNVATAVPFESPKRPTISLDERLRREFGLDDSHVDNDVSTLRSNFAEPVSREDVESQLATPPPPPPPTEPPPPLEPPPFAALRCKDNGFMNMNLSLVKKAALLSAPTQYIPRPQWPAMESMDTPAVPSTEKYPELVTGHTLALPPEPPRCGSSRDSETPYNHPGYDVHLSAHHKYNSNSRW